MAENIIFAEQDLPFHGSGVSGLYLWESVPSVVSLTAGEEYTVVWGEKKFTCKAIETNFNGVDGLGLGNFALAGLGENTEEPFLLGTAVDGSFSACYTTENVETKKVAIYRDDTDYLIKGSTLTAIAQAIRAKTGKTDAIPVTGMAAEIGNITGGGSGSSADVCYVTFMNHDGTVTYGKKAVAVGDDCADPIARGLFSTPTRESTAQYHYTFYGWATTPNGAADANWYKSVTEDKTVYANFSATLRYYTIAYYDGDTVLKTESLAYGAMPNYVPKKAGYILTGWQPELAEVTGAASYTAQWRELSGFEKLFTIDTEYTRDAAINNTGTMLAVAAQVVGTRKAYPPIYDLSGEVPALLTPTMPSPSGGNLEFLGVSFNFDDTKMKAVGQTSNYTYSMREFDVSNPTAPAHSAWLSASGNPLEDSPVADIYFTHLRANPSKLIQSNDTTITLTNYGNLMAYSPDGVHLAAGDNSRAAVYNITTGEQVHDLGGGRANKVSYNSDGSLLAVSHDVAPYVSVYETENYTKVCDLGDVMTAAGWAELVGADTLVVGTGSEILVYTITDSGRKNFEYNVPEYTGAAIKDIVKNHSGTRVVIRCETAVEVWSYV